LNYNFLSENLYRRDGEDSDRIPRTDSGKEMVKTRQCQQTVLLKYQMNEVEVNKTLTATRKAFQKRMTVCKDRQDELIKKLREVNENNNEFIFFRRNLIF
jgi:hypothetical protein